MEINIPIKLYYDRNGLLYTKNNLNKVPFIFKLSNLAYSITLCTPYSNNDYSFQVWFKKGDNTTTNALPLAYVGNETVEGETWYCYTNKITNDILSVSNVNRQNKLGISFYISNGDIQNPTTFNQQVFWASCQYSVTGNQPEIEYTPLDNLQRSIDIALNARPLKEETVLHYDNLPTIVTDSTQSNYNVGYVYQLTSNYSTFKKGDILLATSSGYVKIASGQYKIDNYDTILTNYISDIVIPLIPTPNATLNDKYLVIKEGAYQLIDLPIVDNLLSNDNKSVLSAKQGKVLKDGLEQTNVDITEISNIAITAQDKSTQAETNSTQALNNSTQALEKATQAQEQASSVLGIANNANQNATTALNNATTALNKATSVENQLPLYQTKNAPALTTTSKTIEGAINELNTKSGEKTNYSFENYDNMVTNVIVAPKDTYKIGDTFYLISNENSQLNYEPDRWVSDIVDTPYEVVTQLTNEEIGVGYFVLATISGDKPDITNMVTTNTPQTISGAKDFTGGITDNGQALAKENNVYNKAETNNLLNNKLDTDKMGTIIQVDFDAVIENGKIVCTPNSTFNFDTTSNNKIYEIDIHLPVSSITGSLPYSTEIVVRDSASKNVIINNALNNTTNNVLFGEMEQIGSYNNETGFRWSFFALCSYVNDTTPIIALNIMPTVSKVDNVVITLNNDTMLNAITSGDMLYGYYKIGQIATPSDSNGYTKGLLYQYVNTGTTTSPIYDWSLVTNKNALGLNNVDNTSDLNKPISTDTQNALNNKQAILVSGINIKTVNNNSLLGSGNISINEPTLTSQLTNDSDYQTSTQVNALIKAYIDTITYDGSSENL